MYYKAIFVKKLSLMPLQSCMKLLIHTSKNYKCSRAKLSKDRIYLSIQKKLLYMRPKIAPLQRNLGVFWTPMHLLLFP